MKASDLRPGQFFEYMTAIGKRRCLCLDQLKTETLAYDREDCKNYKIEQTTEVFDCEQCWPCEHEWEVVDDSFDHEFGRFKSVYERCLVCEHTRKYEQPTFGDEQ